MRTDEPRPVRLSEYTPPDFTVDAVVLDVSLTADRAEVRSRLSIRRTGAAVASLRLDGENLELLSLAVDKQTVEADGYVVDGETLTIAVVPDQFELEVVTAFSPRTNTALSGIYLSGERIFSQCEAEGFRRITYFPDRPDVLATYAVRIEADKAAFPTLLSNGNLVDSGDLDGGRHWAQWRDPFPKPSYLFALVAGTFDVLEDTFETMSGRTIPLRLYVDPGDAPRAAFALDALKRAMAWDETAFGREYDLDLFMIVAVRDFNFGAMENKGLNIFNSAVLLADPDTAADGDYETIEAVVAHEYFHNWTGNRITCRDWFQLCLKEGLTVFRDQSFSADERGAAIQRIKSVKRLRARQFPEDAGPLAHPVRPSAYLKIDNFYTATVYEKGAEVIRMLREIIGADAFRRGMDIYFERCDGTAATVEQFIACFEEAAEQDLSAFMGWYGQAGTPRVTVSTDHDVATKTLSLTLSQRTNPTPGQSEKIALPMPIRIGLVRKNGSAAPLQLVGDNTGEAPLDRTLMLESDEQTWRFANIEEPVAVSALRGFSAPVILDGVRDFDELAMLAAHDGDPFNRWEAGHSVARDILCANAERIADGAEATSSAAFVDIAKAALERAADDPAFAALVLTLPDESEIANSLTIVDPAAVRKSRRTLARNVAEQLEGQLRDIYSSYSAEATYSPNATSAAKRALRNTALMLLAELGPSVDALATSQFSAANNITDRIAALFSLDLSGTDAFDGALGSFFTAWSGNPLIVDKWFAVQARSVRADAIERVRKLLDHPSYDSRTPNSVRAVLGVFALANLSAFHDPSGDGYALFTDQVVTIDRQNPALAARLLGAMELWRRLEPGRRAKAQAALEGVRDTANASKNLYEIASKSLRGARD